MVGDVDNYSIVFPPKAPGTHRALLMMSALLIDYQFFEDNAMADN